jgi:hypothetical protein
MGDIDQGVKRLLQLRPQDYLTLAFPNAQPEYLGPLEIDVAMEPQLITDILHRVRLYGVECVVNFEAQAQPDAEMPRRMFKYGARVDIIQDLPVLSVVLIVEPGGKVPPSPYTRTVGPIPILTWHFQNIEVYRLNGRDIINGGMISLMPLVPFMADRSEALFEDAAKTIHGSVGDAAQIESLEGILAAFGARFFGTETVKAIYGRLHMSNSLTDLFLTSPLTQEFLAQAKAEGEAKGKAEGEAKGKAEGMLEGMRELLRLSLEQQFGTLAPAILDALNQADRNTLIGIQMHLATLTLDDLRARLLPQDNGSEEA